MVRSAFPRRRFAALAVLLAITVTALSSCSFLIPGNEIPIDGEKLTDSLPSNNTETNGMQTFRPLPEDTVFQYAERVATAENAGSYAAVVKKVAASVVEIQVETVSTTITGSDYTRPGAGSGVLISKNGCIITCYHVIEGVTNIYVVTNDGTRYTASVVGYDVWSDIALLKIESEKDFSFATFATGKNGENYILPGEEVIAIGNPLGNLGGSVTHGIISALNREITIEGIPMTLLQTDAGVSPGNSGGGLFNMAGELVGIVNAKSVAQNAESIGYAIPSDKALSIADQLASQGYVSGTPQLGLSFSSTSSYLTIASYLYGDELAELNPDLDPYFEIQSGDILSAVDGTSVSSFGDIRTAIADKKVGDTVKVTLYRISGRKVLFDFYTTYDYTTYEVTLRIHEYIPAK